MIRLHNPVHCLCEGVIKNHLLTSERIRILSLCRKSTYYIVLCFVTHFWGFLIHYLYFKVIHCSNMKIYKSGHKYNHSSFTNTQSYSSWLILLIYILYNFSWGSRLYTYLCTNPTSVKDWMRDERKQGYVCLGYIFLLLFLQFSIYNFGTVPTVKLKKNVLLYTCTCR